VTGSAGINTPSQYTGTMTGCILTGSWFRDEERVANEAVMRCWVVLDEVVAKVFSARSPVEDELVMFDWIADPVEPHVHCAGFALFEGVVCDSRSG
jgi:hypothetical protein